ncbi:MAG: uncharacterized protein QOE65_1173 [Solirubrobacteraceae bacterium]|nr:uncharacterized protein [Solirubrobacteraceae bacterium]
MLDLDSLERSSAIDDQVVVAVLAPWEGNPVTLTDEVDGDDELGKVALLLQWRDCSTLDPGKAGDAQLRRVVTRQGILVAMSLPDPRPDETVVVTGASAGIGAELARILAERGHGLTLVARRRDRLEELAGELRGAHGVVVDVHDVDLTDDAAREELIATIGGARRDVAGLCNNAGYGSFGRFWELPREREADMVKLNCLVMADLTSAFLPGMVQRGEGAVLQLGSLAGYQPTPWNATYSATKAFVQSFSESVAGELHGTGVSLTVLCPGPVSTEFGAEAGVEDLEAGLPGFLKQGPREVAQSGVDGMVRGKRVVFPGLPHRFVAQAGRVTPRTALLPIANRIGKRTFGRSRG